MLIVLFYATGFFISLKAQPKIKKEDVKRAEENILIGEYRKALDLYNKFVIIQQDNPEYHYYLGLCYVESGLEIEKSIPHFEFAAQFVNKKISFEVFYQLGCAYHMSNNLDSAISAFETYQHLQPMNLFDRLEVDRQINMCKNAKVFFQIPVNVKVINMGPVINTSFSDYAPLLLEQSDMLIFTSRRKECTGGYLSTDGEYCSDLFFSTKKNNEWTKPKNVGSMINTDNNEVGVGLSNDGKQLIYSRDDYLSNYVNLFITTKHGNSYGKSALIGNNMRLEGEAGTRYTEANACFSADCNTIYFSSNRKGGLGAIDIWKANRNAEGIWGITSNLGSRVNTPYNDEAPFMDMGGLTLYFSSKGHNSIGGYDIFKTVFDSSGLWSIPINLGYPINSTGDDIYYFLTSDGKKAYFSSSRIKGFGCKDIYMYETNE